MMDQRALQTRASARRPRRFLSAVGRRSHAHSDGCHVIRARGAGVYSCRATRRGARREAWDACGALDVTCGCSGLERFERAAYIVYRSRKARKHVTGTLCELPDEHCWLPDERWASREQLSTHHHGARRRRRKTTTVRWRRPFTITYPGDSPPHDDNETEGPFNQVRRVARVRAHRLPGFPASERGPLLPLPGHVRLDVIPLRHHDGLAAHGAARCDLGVSRLGPNGLKIKKETTHDLV